MSIPRLDRILEQLLRIERGRVDPLGEQLLSEQEEGGAGKAQQLSGQPWRRRLRPDRKGLEGVRQCRAQDCSQAGVLRKLWRPRLLNDDRRGPGGRPDQVGNTKGMRATK